MPRPPKRPRCRHFALEALEPRAVPAAMPLHVVVPLDSLEGGQVQAAALQPDGTLELLGTRRTDTLHPWRWIVSPEGKLLSNSGLPTLSDHETGAISRASADGSKLLGWLAGIPDSHLLIWSSPDAPPDDFTFSAASSYAAAASQAASQLQSIEIIGQSTIDADPNAIIDTLRPTAISNNRDVVLSDLNSTALYVWNPTDGLRQLHSLYEVEGQTDPIALAANAAAISADGRIVVGQSGKWESTPRVTEWIDGQPHELPGLPDRPNSATAVSEDGRVVGGVSYGWNFPFRPLLWHDGQLVNLVDEAGNPAVGGVADVISGFNGDPNQWVALGADSSGQDGRPWIAFADGVVHPLDQWLHDRFGLTMGSIQHNVELRADDNGIYIVTFDTDLVAPYPLGREPRPIPSSTLQAHVYILPYDSFGPTASTYDVTGDGYVSPADVLLLINALNDRLANQIDDGNVSLATNSLRLDINRDGHFTAIDILIVINRLNSPADDAPTTSTPPAAEGEPSNGTSTSDLSALAADEFFLTLAPTRRK